MLNQHSSSQNQFWSLLSKKLSKEATPEELEKLQSILLISPDLHHQADLLTEMWEQDARPTNSEDEAAYMRHIMKHKDEFFVEEDPLEINSDIPVLESNPGFLHTLFSKRRLTVLSFIAFIVLATGSIYLFTRKEDIKSPDVQAISSIVTKNGNRTTKIVLPDGSQVWLNAGSNLDYNNSVFNKNLREVTLNGEAYFDVTKNAGKPFIIHTKKMDVKVIGTAFNVRSYNDEKTFEASLIRGSIEVTLKDRKDLKIILKPNQKISIPTDEAETAVSKPGKVPLIKNARSIPPILVNDLKPNPTFNIIGEIAWTQNKLFFDDETLENIGLKMERWFGKKVTIANESLKNVHYTGNYENETLEEVLLSLKLSKLFHYRMGNDNVVIY